eukprot:CAMPEP_0198143784 /NCGR_PEP_ID=MMETSP1443-20131203/10402_1 /TAXON_ID=186043 /ORGANISM="Entomoneis sp., Strain CCMP2396" /LENGTH=297 /DNA_ID=CAMNT_0043807069 /DNA_START=266 /DNA_END=1159 /DNA_ORIENTATION=+
MIAKDQQQSPLQEEQPVSNKKGTAIAVLISNHSQDIIKLKAALESLDSHLSDKTSPVLLFNEGNLNLEQMAKILNYTGRHLEFPIVNFTDFPIGFDPKVEKGNWKKRSKWGYQQMCRFWITKIWEHPALENFSSFMRMDTDSCFGKEVHSYLPGLPDIERTQGSNSKSHYVYSANRISRDGPTYTSGLMDLTEKFIESNGIIPQNGALWNEIKKEYNKTARVKLVYNNFEVANISFFQQPNVMAYQHAVSEVEPFGVFRKRWGDAVVRIITLALFAEDSTVNWIPEEGYMHPCYPKY